MQLTYLLKKTLPEPLRQIARQWKDKAWRLINPEPAPLVPFENQFPWSSPDVWQLVVDFYLSLPDPIIFEYGTGVSTLWHIRNLLARGGIYIGVEHQPDWYCRVLQEILSYGFRHGLRVTYAGQSVTLADFPVSAYDAIIRLTGSALKGCKVKLKLRPPSINKKLDPVGASKDYREYIMALDEPCDAVIVDGRARKACVNHALDTGFLKPGGLLALFEAGRGQEGWLGWPALKGTSDYQPEVHRMLAMGGQLVNGCGVDNWPGLKKRRTPGSNAYFYPAEACFLIRLQEKTKGYP